MERTIVDGMSSALPFSSVTLQFGGDDLDPAEITAVLGLSPSLEARRGELLVRDGEERGTAKTGAWSLRSEWNSTETPDRKIEHMLCRSPAAPKEWQDLVQRFHGRMLCHIEQASARQGFRLSPSTLTQLVERSLPIDVVLECSAVR